MSNPTPQLIQGERPTPAKGAKSLASAPGAKGLFITNDGRNVVVTFVLVSSLFLLWGVCNGMIDVMDKHFQDELSLSKSQSAWVQFAHYLGYFLMAHARRVGWRPSWATRAASSPGC